MLLVSESQMKLLQVINLGLVLSAVSFCLALISWCRCCSKVLDSRFTLMANQNTFAFLFAKVLPNGTRYN